MMRVALITGGARGLGFATAKRLATDGFRVIVADLDEDASRAAAETLPGSGHEGRQLDVADEQSVLNLFRSIEANIGPVAALLNFAAILGTKPGGGRTNLVDLTTLEWDTVFNINARGTFFCIREMARYRQVKPVDHGRIVLISSLAGQAGGMQSGAAYSGSKGAVLTLGKLAARELAPLNITVNTIAPGPIDTIMLRQTAPASNTEFQYAGMAQVPLARVGQPEEIAATAAFLVSPGAAYITGATIDVNGGMLMR